MAGEPVAPRFALKDAEVGVVLFEGFVEVLEVLLFLLRGEPVLGNRRDAEGGENDGKHDFSYHVYFHKMRILYYGID